MIQSYSANVKTEQKVKESESKCRGCIWKTFIGTLCGNKVFW